MKYIGPYLLNEDSCGDKFGNVLFGDFLGYKEKDTKIESRIFDDLYDWIADNEMRSDRARILKAFQELKKCSKHWPDILEPDKTRLFRGTKIALEEAYDMGLHKKDRVSGKYKSKSIIQSWTTDSSSAIRFANSNKLEWHSANVVVENSFPKSELLFDSKFLDKITDVIGFKKEHEIVRLGNKPISAKFHLAESSIGLVIYGELKDSLKKKKEVKVKNSKDIYTVKDIVEKTEDNYTTVEIDIPKYGLISLYDFVKGGWEIV